MYSAVLPFYVFSTSLFLFILLCSLYDSLILEFQFYKILNYSKITSIFVQLIKLPLTTCQNFSSYS